MSTFHLPDLGEGLPDAEIHVWYVKEGDTVQTDQLLLSVETAKAVVDVPSPQSGTISKCFGKPGEIIKTGQPLVQFEDLDTIPQPSTIVGQLEESTQETPDHFTVGLTSSVRVRITPGLRLLAKQLQVDPATIQGTGQYGLITRADLEQAARQTQPLLEGFEPLRGVRRAMLQSMVEAHQQVVPVTLFDDVDLHPWPDHADLTVRLIRAIAQACQAEPALNAWYDGKRSARKCFQEVNLGLAMDSEVGLFVPVLHDVTRQTDQALRQQINQFKQTVHDRTVPPEALKGATIMLSNFGKFAGRHATPILIPPCVAILGVGRLYQGVVADDQQFASHPLLPLSLTFDHRAVTGGEATRFLGACMQALMSTNSCTNDGLLKTQRS